MCLPRRPPHTVGRPQPAPKVSLLPPQPLVPCSEATGTSLPAGLCLQLVLAAGQGRSRGRSPWDKAPFTALASHAPSSASASCHQLALLPRRTAGGGGQDQGLTLPVQSLEEREMPLLHALSPVHCASSGSSSQVPYGNMMITSAASWDLAPCDLALLSAGP